MLFIIVFLAGFGTAIALQFARTQLGDKNTTSAMAAFVVVAMFAAALPSQAQSGLNLDLEPIWDGINNNLPWALGLMGAIGGISIALALGQWVISLFQKFFKGGSR